MGGNPGYVHVADRRDSLGFLRVSSHGSKRVVVFSQWRLGVCVASTPVPVSELSSVISVLVGALEDASKPQSAKAAEPSIRSIRRDVRRLVDSRFRPRLAPVVDMVRRSTGSPGGQNDWPSWPS